MHVIREAVISSLRELNSGGRHQIQAVAEIDHRTDGARLLYFACVFPTDLLQMPSPVQGAGRIRFPEIDTRAQPIILILTDFEGFVL